MPYVQPYTYVQGTVLGATDQASNDDDAKTAINQETVTADYASATFDYDSIQRGELEPITNQHQFTTGETHGRFSDTIAVERAYFTSETKAGDQILGSEWQDLYHTGDRFYMETSGTAFLTFGSTFVCAENSNTSAGPGRGLWDSEVLLKYIDEDANTVTYVAGTSSFCFEETGAATAGTNDPGGDGTNARRWIGFEWMVTGLSEGWYQFSVVVNPKVEQGYTSARQYTLETFYT